MLDTAADVGHFILEGLSIMSSFVAGTNIDLSQTQGFGILDSFGINSGVVISLILVGITLVLVGGIFGMGKAFNTGNLKLTARQLLQIIIVIVALVVVFSIPGMIAFVQNFGSTVVTR